MQQVASGIYVETGYASGNVGFVVTSEGVVCIDVPMILRDVRDWRAKIESVTDRPIVALIQTDCDQERTAGAAWVDAPLIAHDAAYERIRTLNSDKVAVQAEDSVERSGWDEDARVRLPDITFSERLVLHKGDREIHIIYGGGHSLATSMVYLPGDNIVFAGDVIYCNAHPSMGQAETKQWLLTLSQLRKMPVDLVIPGHGACCDKEATYTLSEYIRAMRSAVRRHFQAGRSKSETSSAMISEFMDAFPYGEKDRETVRQLVKGGSDRIYDEFRAVAKADATRAKTTSAKSKARGGKGE
jgi:cyclase